ncbi:MAG TPA: hypothetical protein VMU66_01655 [Gaiellales bacterium]|nr:hypothetical protein [Gaiellales bacterium]
MDADAHPRRPLSFRAELALAAAISALATLHAEWAILFSPYTFQSDAMIHEWWMRQWRDPALFHDPLTAAVKATGFVPVGLRAIDWTAAQLVDPVAFAAWTPLLLVPASVGMLFAIVRDHTSWRPAAWLACALFVVPWDIERFSGGHARAYAQPIALAALLLAQRGRERSAAAVPPLGALVYPPAAAAALAMLGLRSLVRVPRRTRLLLVGASTAATLAAVELSGSHPPLTLAEAQRSPDFGAHGQLPLFGHSLVTYLSQNFTGFNLLGSGSLLAVAAAAVIAIRWRTAREIRLEVWATAVSALAVFAFAQAVLLRLYLPNRYTYPLLPVFCIVIAVGWLPAWRRLARSLPAPLLWAAAVAVPAAIAGVALAVSPLGPRMSASALGRTFLHAAPVTAAGLALVAAAIVLRRRRAAPVLAAAVAAALLFGQVAYAGGGASPAQTCTDLPLLHELAGLPVGAVIAGDPRQMNCVPIVSLRAVVISQKLYQPIEIAYTRVVRTRMRAMATAEFGPSRASILALRRRFDASYLVVQPSTLRTRRVPAGWQDMEPYTSLIARLLRAPAGPAALRLPAACAVWRRPPDVVYDLACVAARSRR